MVVSPVHCMIHVSNLFAKGKRWSILSLVNMNSVKRPCFPSVLIHVAQWIEHPAMLINSPFKSNQSVFHFKRGLVACDTRSVLVWGVLTRIEAL